METIDIKPEIIKWAIKRSGFSETRLNSKKFQKYFKWITGEKKPNLKLLESFSKAVYIPFGYLFLDKPILEKLPISDFRTFNNRPLIPSVNLIDTIQKSIIRQEWFSRNIHDENSWLNFKNNYTIEDDTVIVSKSIRKLLNIDLLNSNSLDDCSFRKQLSIAIEKLGILVVFSGIVDGNTSRSLDLNEFRGFALYDKKAPLIFVNSKDSYKAQNFTLIHELGHILLKQSGLTDLSLTSKNKIELWCNKLAGEVLLPDSVFYDKNFSEGLVDALSKAYNVSELVVISRMHSMKMISWDLYTNLYSKIKDDIDKYALNKPKTMGGNYYTTKTLSLSARFVDTVLFSTVCGTTTHHEAYSLLNISENTFKQYLIDRRFG